MDRGKLKEIIKDYEGKRQALLPCLHYIQKKHGYINEKVMSFLAKELGIPRVDIYGVVSFYSMFSLQPQGKYVIRVCASLSCYLKGSNNILNTLKEVLGIDAGETTPDGKFTIEEVSCLGLCDKAPAMMINNKDYINLTSDKVKNIIESYKKEKES
ncbi:MAG: NADH-quinone oxidoreductase subunit NuoE [Deltaproteobacteria bacterium]|nr:MAG: NADH-quinone oxidoreductase subunit NuoE [Deltaproteobacteria bacterium]